MAKYTLTKNAVRVARSILGVPGACKGIDDIYRGGKMLAVTLPGFPEVDGKESTAGLVTAEIELDGPERDLLKSGLTHCLSKDMVPASEYLSELIEKLEFISKPK